MSKKREQLKLLCENKDEAECSAIPQCEYKKTKKRSYCKPKMKTGSKYKNAIYKDRSSNSICLGKSEEECNATNECKYTVGKKRTYCRRLRNGIIFQQKKKK
jgi:hypothetical protein